MKKCLFFMIVCAALLVGAAPRASAHEISAKSAILYEPVTGTVLFEKNADERLLIASTTKIMTAMVVLENCELDETVTARSEHASVEGSSMYLKPGETYTVHELLYGLMLASGNDAAVALAEHTAGSTEAFARLMNDKCRAMGLVNTHFENPHGLDGEEHYSSARDLARITAEAMENEAFCEIFSTSSFTCHELTYTNHNKLLTSLEGCTGGKTGYTEKAGRILVSSAEREGLELICVTISDPKDWEDHKALYDEAFESYRFFPLPDGSEDYRLEVVSGNRPNVSLVCAEKGLLVEKARQIQLKQYLPDFVYAPVKKGDVAGYVELSVNGELDLRLDVYYADTVFVDESMMLTPWERFKRVWQLANQYGVYYPQF